MFLLALLRDVVLHVSRKRDNSYSVLVTALHTFLWVTHLLLSMQNGEQAHGVLLLTWSHQLHPNTLLTLSSPMLNMSLPLLCHMGLTQQVSITLNVVCLVNRTSMLVGIRSQLGAYVLLT